MRLKIEPKEFFMYAVFLAFSTEHPDPEDEAIKAAVASPRVQAMLDGKEVRSARYVPGRLISLVV